MQNDDDEITKCYKMKYVFLINMGVLNICLDMPIIIRLHITIIINLRWTIYFFFYLYSVCLCCNNVLYLISGKKKYDEKLL